MGKARSAYDQDQENGWTKGYSSSLFEFCRRGCQLNPLPSAVTAHWFTLKKEFA